MDDYDRKNRIRQIYEEQISEIGGGRLIKRPHPVLCVEGSGVKRRKRRVVRRVRSGSKAAVRRSGSKVVRKRAPAKRKGTVPKGTSRWILHVKKYAKTHGISYGEAMKKARSSYDKKSSKSTTRKRVKRAGVLVGGRRRVKRAGVLVGGKQKKLIALIKKLM